MIYLLNEQDVRHRKLLRDGRSIKVLREQYKYYLYYRKNIESLVGSMNNVLNFGYFGIIWKKVPFVVSSELLDIYLLRLKRINLAITLILCYLGQLEK